MAIRTKHDTPTGHGGPIDSDTSGVPSLDDVADEVHELKREHPWIERLARWGWVAKGVVYGLMGVLAVSIARQQPAQEDASPEGAISVVLEQPFGRALLGVLAVGFVLYSVWRLLSVAIIRGSGGHEWLERIGYTFSAVFYLTLAWTAGRAAQRGYDPERSSTVEDLSRSLLERDLGRWLTGAVGVVIIGVAVYFLVKGLRKSFLDDLDLSGATEAERHVVETSGVVGWIGRAVVTGLVGVFVTAAAVNADPADARGFDQSLREVATDPTGTWVVLAAAIGLVVYGVHCLVIARRVELRG